jgi:hypothetical protein
MPSGVKVTLASQLAVFGKVPDSLVSPVRDAGSDRLGLSAATSCRSAALMAT